MKLVQCRTVQFNEHPEVNSFEKEDQGAADDNNDRTEVPPPPSVGRSRKVSVGGPGPLYDFAAEFGVDLDQVNEKEGEEEEEEEEGQEEAQAAMEETS